MKVFMKIGLKGAKNEMEDERSKEKNNKKDRYSLLRFRSTGLGKTLLEGEPMNMEIVGDTLVLHIQSTRPVRWHIRAAMTYKGLLKLLKLSLKLSIIKFFLFGAGSIKKPNLPDEF